MALATYQSLCIDVTDERVEGEFWSRMLGWDLDDRLRLVDDAGTPRVWLNPVPEPKIVKNRLHIDVHAESVDRALDAGARVLYETERWTTLADPEGQEFCLFVRPAPVTVRPYEIGWDCSGGLVGARRQAEWWAAVVGGTTDVDDAHGFAWVEQIPDCPWDSLDFAPVPEPKTVKNRLHLDLDTDDLDALVAHGATVLRAKGDDGIGWTVLADPQGNEFCAFTAD